MKRLLLILGLLLVLLLVGPLMVPIPPLRGTLPPQELADADSRFIPLQGLQVHYKAEGQGRPVLMLLHGFGASVFSWREVMGLLAERGTVVAYDRPGFGLTSRPLPGQWTGPNPYSPDSAAGLTIALMDSLGIQQAVLVGHSAGGAVALLTALRHPQRVQALVLVDAAVYEGGPPPWLQPLLRTPQARRIGPLFVRYSLQAAGNSALNRAWHDPDRIDPQALEGYRKPLQVENWDRALWEVTLAARPLDTARLAEITVPALVITGDDDRIVPAELSLRLAGDLPQARLVVIPACGHLPQEECPQAFLEAVSAFLDALEGPG